MHLEKYMLIQGIPGLLSIVDPHLTYIDNINKAFELYGSFLSTTIEKTLFYRYRESSMYNYILFTLSTGPKQLSDISDTSSIATQKLCPYINVLLKDHILDKVIPKSIGDTITQSKYPFYFIKKPIVELWYRFLSPSHYDYYLKHGITPITNNNSLNDFFNVHIWPFVFDILKEKSNNHLLPFHFTEDTIYIGHNRKLYHLMYDKDCSRFLMSDIKFSHSPYSRKDFNSFIQNIYHEQNQKLFYTVFSKKGYEDSFKAIAEANNIILLEENDILSKHNHSIF